MNEGRRNSLAFGRAAKRMAAFVEKFEGELGTVLYMIAEEIATDVKTTRGKVGVPRDTGTLANSIRAVKLTPKSAAVTAGGAAREYALVQHERTDYQHRIGEPRYLVRGGERWRPGQARKALRAQAKWAAEYAKGVQ